MWQSAWYAVSMRILPLLLACCLLGAVEPSPAPGPVAQRALELTAKHQQFTDWALVDAFRRAGGQQPWRADAERFLGDLARHLAAREFEAHRPEFEAAGRKLLAAGCDDPLVRLRLGSLLGGSEGSKLVAGSIAPLRALAGTPGAYPGLHLVSALRRQTDPRTRKLTAEAARDLPDAIVAASREALVAPCGRALAVDHLVDWFGVLFDENGLAKDGIDRTLAGLEAPGGDVVLAGILRGRAAITAAWAARGGGWANTVTEEGWKGFRASLAEARRSLTAAWQALPESTSAASLMISVTMGDGSNEERLWFGRAMAADPACKDAWDRMSNALQPRWGGSTQQLLALAQQGVTDARPGNRLGRVASDVLVTFVDEGGDEAAAWKEIARLDAFCPPEPGPDRIFRAMGAAWHAGRKPQAVELFVRNGGIAAPSEALDAAPFGRFRGMRLLSSLERARLGQAEPVVRPIPTDGTAHRGAEHAPTYFTLLPSWWQAHARHDPAWHDRIRGLLEKRAVGAESPFVELVDAGCTDPVVRFLAGRDRPKPSPTERRANLLACWDEYEAAGYPPVAIWQPAWFLMRDLYSDKAVTSERSALTSRFAALAGKVALSIGRDGVTGSMVLFELGDLPAPDPALLDLIDCTAAMPGIEPALASGLTGMTAFARAQRLAQNDPQRGRQAWIAISRLWPAWNAYHHPKTAAVLSTASCLAGLRLEARCWFDESVRRAYDDSMPWFGLSEGYALTGSPDELLAFAAEIAELPVSCGSTLRALVPIHWVLTNRWLSNRERLKSAWASVDRVTSGSLADPAIAADLRGRLLYWRIACAALAGDQPAVTAAIQALGAPYDPKRLPQGIDPAKIEAAVSAAQPVMPAKPSDF
jgi:hypothetical protein